MKKGFTLIELLAVIFLLGTVALIATVSILSILNNSREDLYEEQVSTIEKKAKNYQLATPGLPDNTSVSLEDLSNAGFLDSSDLEDPRDSSELCGNVKITYNETKNQYTFKFQREDC